MSNPDDLFGGEFFPAEVAEEMAMDWVSAAYAEHELFADFGGDTLGVATAQYDGKFSMSDVHTREAEVGTTAFDLATSIIPDGITNETLLDPERSFVDEFAGMILSATYGAMRQKTVTVEDMNLIKPTLTPKQAADQFAANRPSITRELLETDLYHIRLLKLGETAASLSLVRMGAKRCNLALITRQLHLHDYALMRHPEQG